MARGDTTGRGGWQTDHLLWLETFVLFNFAGLIADIFLAHSENHFRRQSEYVPLLFSAAATVALAVMVPLRHRFPAMWRDGGTSSAGCRSPLASPASSPPG